jgi:hypothetical protein
VRWVLWSSFHDTKSIPHTSHVDTGFINKSNLKLLKYYHFIKVEWTF